MHIINACVLCSFCTFKNWELTFFWVPENTQGTCCISTYRDSSQMAEEHIYIIMTDLTASFFLAPPTNIWKQLKWTVINHREIELFAYVCEPPKAKQGNTIFMAFSSKQLYKLATHPFLVPYTDVCWMFFPMLKKLSLYLGYALTSCWNIFPLEIMLHINICCTLNATSCCASALSCVVIFDIIYTFWLLAIQRWDLLSLWHLLVIL